MINEADLPSRMVVFSDMIVFSSYALQVVMAFMLLIMVFILMPRATVYSILIINGDAFEKLTSLL